MTGFFDSLRYRWDDAGTVVPDGPKRNGQYGRSPHPPVGAVHRAALTFVIRPSSGRAARWTAPTGAVHVLSVPPKAGLQTAVRSAAPGQWDALLCLRDDVGIVPYREVAGKSGRYEA